MIKIGYEISSIEDGKVKVLEKKPTKSKVTENEKEIAGYIQKIVRDGIQDYISKAN